MYSSASARDSRDALNYFERIRSFFIQLTGKPPAKALPIYIIAFGTEKEYEPYRVKDFAIAYYAGHAERDYIVMGKTGEEAERIAAHEYAHLVFRHAGYHLPPWLNEGMAELFSTMKASGKDAIFGQPIVGRLQELQSEAWVPLRTILEADEKSPYYNETKRAGNLYNEGWAMAHLLTTTNEYRSKFNEFFAAVASGVPSVDALERAYGKPLAKFENDLRLYIAGQQFNSLVAKIKLDDIEKLPVSPADSFDVRYLQADLLLNLMERSAEGVKRMQALALEQPNRPEPQSTLGYLAWRDGKQTEAVEHFGKAIEGGARTPKLLWDYARLARQSSPKGAEQAVIDLIKLEPKNSEYRMYLAGLQMEQRKYPEALATLKQITEVATVDVRDNLLYQRAVLAMNAGDRNEARARVEELKRLTKSQDFANRADQILRFFQQPQPVVVAGVQPAITDRQRPIPAQTPARQTVVRLTVAGSLVEFQCGEQPHFIVDTDQGRKDFVILQTNNVDITGSEAGHVDFECGPQKPARKVQIEYSAPPNEMKVDGVVRGVHFE
jgi:Flp pilus assembly protein TadD